MSSATPDDATTSRTSHEINWIGFSGGILWVSLISVFFTTLGYSTTGWYTASVKGGREETGLWEKCSCIRDPRENDRDYVRATQAFATLGMIALALAMFASLAYMLIHRINKSHVLIVIFAAYIVATIFLIIAIAVYGSEMKKNVRGTLSYSYAFTVIGSVLALTGAILTFVQMEKSGMIVC